MENGSSGQNCNFTSYISERGSEHRGPSSGGRRSEKSARGVFAEVRRMRLEDEKREAQRSELRSVRFSKRREPSAAAQAGKFAVLLACVCAFSLLFALKISNSDMSGETLAVFRSAMNGSGGEETEEERLGRLKLVQLPGLLSVFAASDLPVAPLSTEQAITDDSFTARLFSSPGTEVVSMLSGTVRSVDPAGEHGGSVTVACKNGVDITYMGLGEILVERGQPVLQRTALGRLSGEILYLRVTRDGAPIDPLEFLGTAARVG
ncbi:MAG: M23 family metallopeptidase [Clostridia bacterium]|nr:M23 family metallopeptidase [Clostridia bacterium]